MSIYFRQCNWNYLQILENLYSEPRGPQSVRYNAASTFRFTYGSKCSTPAISPISDTNCAKIAFVTKITTIPPRHFSMAFFTCASPAAHADAQRRGCFTQTPGRSRLSSPLTLQFFEMRGTRLGESCQQNVSAKK